jgi:hypothetical protein
MKSRRLLLFVFWLAVAGALAAVTTLPLAADDRDDHRDHGKDWARECSLRTLHGRYGIFAQGTVLATSAHPALPFVVSGIFTYDGDGSVAGTYNQSVGGGASTGVTASGTYQVNPDCTYSAVLTLPDNSIVHRAGTITGEGILQEIHIVYTDSSSVASGTLKKIRKRPCSLRTLKGPYALFGQGTILPPGASFPRATAGILTFDGEGNFSGEATGNTSGASAQGSFTGTYAVTPECGVSAEIHVTSGPNTGLTLDEAGSITGDEDFKELHDIFTTPGWVFTDTLKKQR